MGVLDKLFPCRSCQAKDREIASLERQLEWAQREISAQNKRLLEIAEPRGNERIAAAERGPRKRLVPAGPPADTFPGDFAPPPPMLVEVDNGEEPTP